MRPVRVRTAILVAVVSWVVLFWRLGHVGLIDDEAIYARLTHEMAEAGDWLVPQVAGEPFIDKPVFFHWVQRLTMAVVPDDELSARLPSALAALGLFATLAWLGASVGDKRLGRSVWLLAATMPATFLLGRTGYMDMLFTALLFGVVALITKAQLDGDGWPQAGAVVCLALAILTKGPVAAVLVSAWLAAMWVAGGESRRGVSRLNLGPAVIAVCALAAPWFLWMYSQYGTQFVNEYFGQNHAGYFTPRHSRSSSDWLFYVRMFLTSFFPWSFVTIGYGIDTVRRVRRGLRVPAWELGLWLWMAIVLVAFTLVPFRVDRYIYPAGPACCLLAARGWLSARAESGLREFAATRAAAGLVALILIGAGIAVWWSLPSLAVKLPVTVSVLPVMLVLGGLAILISMLRGERRLPAVTGWPALTLVTAYAVLVLVGLPIVRAGLPVEQVGRFMADRTSSGEPVAVLGLERWEVGLAYYLHQAPQRLEDATEAERFAKTPGPRWVVMRRESLGATAPSGCVTLSIPAIVGTKGRGIRTQVWGDVVVVRYDAVADSLKQSCAGM
jgi:4-amino-4-deoxy-L-arabinose transferase-like glycosyltransferase